MTEAPKNLLTVAAARLGCAVDDLRFRLSRRPDFDGHGLLPTEVIDAWESLPIEARAIAILFADSLNDENNRRLERW